MGKVITVMVEALVVAKAREGRRTKLGRKAEVERTGIRAYTMVAATSSANGRDQFAPANLPEDARSMIQLNFVTTSPFGNLY